MKFPYLVLLFVIIPFSFATQGCKKKSGISPIDSFAGTYVGVSHVLAYSAWSNDTTTNNTYPDSMIIFKASFNSFGFSFLGANIYCQYSNSDSYSSGTTASGLGNITYIKLPSGTDSLYIENDNYNMGGTAVTNDVTTFAGKKIK